MDNTTSNYTSPLSGPEFVVFNVILLVGVVLPVAVLNVVLLVAVILESSTAKIIRLIMGSILVSCLIVALGLVMYHISGLVLNLAPVDNLSDISCTIILFVLVFGSAGRLVFMAAFAVTVYLVVKYRNATKRRALYLSIVAVVILWGITFVGNSPVFSDVVVFNHFVDRLSCGPIPTGVATYVYASLYIITFGVVAFIMTIVFLIMTVLYVRQRTVPGNRESTHGMIKFGFFLMLGNSLNVLVQILPSLLAVLIVPPSSVDADRFVAFAEGIYVSYTLFSLSLIPTPICMLIFFSRLRQKVASWFCCSRKKEMVTSQGVDTVDTKVLSTHL